MKDWSSMKKLITTFKSIFKKNESLTTPKLTMEEQKTAFYNEEVQPFNEINNMSLEAENLTKLEEVLIGKISNAVVELKSATPLSRPVIQEKIFQFLRELYRCEQGMELAYQVVPQLEREGIFKGGGWEREDKLNPFLVRGSLLSSGVYPTLETLSELRLMAIAEEKISSEHMSKDEARQFLLEVMALNLNFIFGHENQTEEERISAPLTEIAAKLFRFLRSKLDLHPLFGEVVREARELIAQRPITTYHIKRVLNSAQNLVSERKELSKHEDFEEYECFYKAITFSSPLSAKNPDILEYRKTLKKASQKSILKECEFLGENLKKTGLAGKKAAVLVRFVAKNNPDLLPVCLGLNDIGAASFEKNKPFIVGLINMAMKPSTYNTIYGLTCFINREILSQTEVKNGLKKLIEIDINHETQRLLLKLRDSRDNITANAILVCGLISVLGQPLGVSQGSNPTCQTARGISLWSQHDPGYLIDILLTAAKHDVFETEFEGEKICSKNLEMRRADQFVQDIDPVSIVLSSHLDAVYAEILKRTAGRGEDSHKWANPALYGRFINGGFASVLDNTQTKVSNYENFIRQFFSTHHPDYMEDHLLTYANPVGIFITSSYGDLIGLHAISIQRVKFFGDEETARVYFYNPNREGRQNWGQGIRPSVCGHGERSGENSLPFNQFASRLYAFHFNPYEDGDGFGVPHEEISEVMELAKESWGRSYGWA